MRKLKTGSFVLSTCALALLAPTSSFGALINGSQLNFNGNAVVGATFLNWQCNQPGDAAGCTPGYGDFATQGNTGSFAQYNGTFGQILSINNTTAPLNLPVNVPNFIKFDLNNNIVIDLTLVPVGNDPTSTTCAGLQHCTPTNAALVTAANPGGLSAFNLDQNATGTAATFGVFGNVRENGVVSGTTAGTFTAQFTGLNPSQVLAAALAGAQTAYSANFNLTVSTVPEPQTSAMVGLGLIGIGLLSRRRRS